MLSKRCMLERRNMELSSDWDTEELGCCLGEMGIHEDVVGNVNENRILAHLFLELTEDDLKELASTKGDRIALRKEREQLV